MRFWLIGVVIALAACDLSPPDPARVADECEQRARAAQAPTGSVTLGTSSSTGAFAGASVGITTDLLRGRDPLQVYENCVIERTGELPVRPPVLRDI